MTVQKIKKMFGPADGGFTLIELLIVIAILGVLAVVVLVAINPIEQLAKTRDSGRISGVTQIGHAAQAFYTSRNATWPGEGTNNWHTDLTTSGELSVLPALITYSAYGVTACGGGDVPTQGWCYDTDGQDAVVWSRLESNSWTSQCTTNAYAVFSTADGRGGVICDTEPSPGAQGGWIN